ncbi:MAG: GNAT family N-acetyltransferase [Lachnospiraceae bacterium]|nr:GNAT family N-acetyltransferase [Lachnospiraceae bacterium]
MEIRSDNIILRDFQPGDIEDEVRWNTTHTEWMKADMPWEEPEPVDEDELRAQMAEIMEGTEDGDIRMRLEIEADGRHVGFVSSYLMNEDYSPIDWETVDFSKNAPDNHAVRALGIELCESDVWGQGIGVKALQAFMEYYRGLGEDRFVMETWSGNVRMLRVAEKLGFREVDRGESVYVVDGRAYDALVLELR